MPLPGQQISCEAQQRYGEIIVRIVACPADSGLKARQTARRARTAKPLGVFGPDKSNDLLVALSQRGDGLDGAVVLGPAVGV